MGNTHQIVEWPGGDSERWNAVRGDRHIGLVVLELGALPNLAGPRFKHLGEGLAERRSEMVRRQTQMLMQLHGLGENCGIALRLCKDDRRVRAFVIVRLAMVRPPSDTELTELAERVAAMGPREYVFQRVTPNTHPHEWRLATDVTWATQVDELVKQEQVITADTFDYYLVPLWMTVGSHDLEAVSGALLDYVGMAMVDITMIPTRHHTQEIDWISQRVGRMRQAVSGMTLQLPNGASHRLEPAPQLRGPVENYEKLLERYQRERLFLTSFRVFASGSPTTITHKLAAAAVSNQPRILTCVQPSKLFEQQRLAAALVDIAPEVRWDRWSEETQQPNRVQRLHRLCDVNEVSSFWRLPIAGKATFAGFEVDSAGVGGSGSESTPRTTEQIRLGELIDDSSRQKTPAIFDRESLAKHGLVVGVPGSGKTTLMFSILHQLWVLPKQDQKIPFIVLEPAKTEFRALKQLDGFKDDLLIFTLGDERISPFRFNPFAVPEGTPLESHIAKLNACFIGAFNLFDPLPLLLDRAIREMYADKGWLDDSVGGEVGVETPRLRDLVEHVRVIINDSGYSLELRSNFNASLLQRLESLRRGSKGRMLDTRESIDPAILMERPVILELDALNGDEKALLMMFVLSFVYEYAKTKRRSGSRLSHVLLVEEAHNLIGRGTQSGSDQRGNPREHSIQLFVRMLAEMRALGEGILIADQLPTALAPEAVKQTNIKILMRLTAMDDREEIGNTMDLEAEHLKAVPHLKTGQAYAFLDKWDRVRMVQTDNFKEDMQLEQPPDDAAVADAMRDFEMAHPSLYMPFAECSIGCSICDRRVRSLAEQAANKGSDIPTDSRAGLTACQWYRNKFSLAAKQASARYGQISPIFEFCAFVHALQIDVEAFEECRKENKSCKCTDQGPVASLERILHPERTTSG